MNMASSQLPQERRARTRKEIKTLIAERNKVLSLYYNLASKAEKIDDKADSLVEQLQEFCQELIDYLATGHFEIYRRLEEGDERRDDMIGLADQIYSGINKTTQAAVDFNDMYDISEGFDVEILQELPRHLSTLGQELATRIDLEDRFIDTLLTAPSRDTAQASAT
jgi:regulator of sigma D